MSVTNKFQYEVEVASKYAADFLMEKHKRYTGSNGIKRNDRPYSGERESVAKVYRLLICNDPSYRKKLFFEAIRPDRGEESGKLIPDLVYRNGNIEKCVMEVKAPLNSRANGSELPYKSDMDNIKRDYEKLKENYTQFDTKFLIVAYLGDPILENGNEFPLEDFEKRVHSEFPDKGKIKVIAC
jgi:hypothetical protein